MKKNLGLFALVFLILLSSCGPKQKIVYVPTPIPEPPKPSLREQLDKMYKADFEKWREEMTRLIGEENEELPTQHLLYAIKEFNEDETRSLCIDASYLYMRNKIKETGGLSGPDEKMFKEFIEYALKDTDDKALLRVKMLCRNLESEICNEFKR